MSGWQTAVCRSRVMASVRKTLAVTPTWARLSDTGRMSFIRSHGNKTFEWK